MQTEAGNLRLVDYGGNAFLFANETEVSISFPKMLVKADNEFIQNILLTHLITFGIGKKKFQSGAQHYKMGGDFLNSLSWQKTSKWNII